MKMLYKKKIFIILYFLGFFFIIFLCLFILMQDECICPSSKNAQKRVGAQESNHFIKPNHKLAILVPFRDRFNELLKFGPHMTKFLRQQSINYEIYVLNQIDNYRFNRASLINVGFKFTRNECDYLAMHDVDLLPLNDQLSYGYPKSGVFHVSSPALHPKYDYPTFIGGILIVKREDFQLVNGMSNRYWGWGLEDDEFYIRLKDSNIEVVRPSNITTKKHNSFWHNHDKNVRKRDTQKCFNQREVTHKRDRSTGLHDVNYTIESVQNLLVDESPMKVLNIRLQCDRSMTPWCTCDPLPQGKSNSSQGAIKSQKSLKTKKLI